MATLSFLLIQEELGGPSWRVKLLLARGGEGRLRCRGMDSETGMVSSQFNTSSRVRLVLISIRSTGKVGWGAVSYYAMSIYQTAVLGPPHLAAIIAWEGMSDIYREVNVVGGIPGVSFQHLWMDMTGYGLGKSEDHAAGNIEHPTYDDWWKSKVVDWSKIDIPAFSITGWSSLGLHLRGTIAA